MCLVKTLLSAKPPPPPPSKPPNLISGSHQKSSGNIRGTGTCSTQFPPKNEEIKIALFPLSLPMTVGLTCSSSPHRRRSKQTSSLCLNTVSSSSSSCYPCLQELKALSSSSSLFTPSQHNPFRPTHTHIRRGEKRKKVR